MYAFWKYDLYPNMLGGKASKVETRTNVKGNYLVAYVDSYATWFRIEFLLDDEQGKLLCEKIDILKLEYDRVFQMNKETFVKRFNDLLNTLPVQKINV